MKNIINRSVYDVVCAKLPLKIIGQEIKLEKEFNDRIGRGDRKAFANFRDLLSAFQGTCSLFAKDGELEAALLCVCGGSEVVGLRETIRQKLLKTTELLDDDESKLDEGEIKLRITETHKIIAELRAESFPRLLDSLWAVKKNIEDGARK